MLTVTRPVYYCEHCKRHRLTAAAIQAHEPRCVYNPDRATCGWHGAVAGPARPAALVKAFRFFGLDLAWLRRRVAGCPACMLAVVVQAHLSFAERAELEFAYQAEVDRFRAEERRDDF